MSEPKYFRCPRCDEPVGFDGDKVMADLLSGERKPEDPLWVSCPCGWQEKVAVNLPAEARPS